MRLAYPELTKRKTRRRLVRALVRCYVLLPLEAACLAEGSEASLSETGIADSALDVLSVVALGLG